MNALGVVTLVICCAVMFCALVAWASAAYNLFRHWAVRSGGEPNNQHLKRFGVSLVAFMGLCGVGFAVGLIGALWGGWPGQHP